MNKQQFEEVLKEKFKKAPELLKVLRFVLNGRTCAEISQSRKTAEGTIRAQMTDIYEKFGIKIEFPGDKPHKDQLQNLFRQHKPEWVNNDISSSAHEKIKQLENNNIISLVSSDGKLVADVEEDLMSLAINILEQIGFDEIFKMNRALNCVGYRLKSPGTSDKRYQIFIKEDAFGLSISINKEILEPYLLNLKYLVYLGDDIGRSNWGRGIAGIFLVIPGKENLFLNSLQPQYWNLLEVERKTAGDVYLNDKEDPEYYDYTTEDTTNKCLDGFNKYDLSHSDSYLVIHEDQDFNYTWQMFIDSREVLKDFLVYFGKILMNIEFYNASDNDDIPF